ncbi:MAG: hypothetical protein RL701_5068 [Pseudomonadota bacterium]
MLPTMRMWLLMIALTLCSAAQATHAHADERGARQHLTDLRLSSHQARRTAGFWLLGFGAASTLGGGVIAVIGHNDKAWLAAGITTASFGIVNALLSFGLLDISDSDKERILAARTHGVFLQQRERELVTQLKSGQFFAVNAGLDLFYLATGAFLCVIAGMNGGKGRWELGAGIAAIGQSVFLLGFDVANWIGANNRAAGVQAL